jgi:hypothetical protein
MFIREDEADITLTINGSPILDNFATYEGGDLTANTAKTRPGNTRKQVSVGGPATRSDITITTQFTDTAANAVDALEALTGNGSCVVAIQWLDGSDSPIPGAGFTRTGTLKTVTPPNANIDGNAVGMLSIVIDADEQGT